jgi:hypothetical protein
MSGTRGQQRQQTVKRDDNVSLTEDYQYFPPCSLLLEGLGISATDLTGGGAVAVAVTRKFLRELISEFVCRMRMDENWYAETYPDVEGARLAGDIESLREHFVRSGYLEGRLPAALPFDPQWYRRHYRDIADAFPSADPDEMRTHFLTSGYFEGRAGTAEMLAAVERWQALAKE